MNRLHQWFRQGLIADSGQLFSSRIGLLSLVAGLWLAPGSQVALAQVPSAVSQGYTLLQRGWVNDAIATFRQALQRYPQSLEAQLGLAIAYQRAGQDANAWQAYQQVLRQAPQNQQALRAIGTLGGYRSEWQAQGIEALSTLLSIAPQDQEARLQRATLLGYQGRFAEALSDYAPLLTANATPQVLLGAAQAYTYSRDYKQGLSLFERYLATGAAIPPDRITAYALALQETGNPAQAVTVLATRLQQLRSLDDNAIQIRAALAVAYQANQQTEAALETLEPLRGQTKAALPLARALSAIGRQAQDVSLYDEAVAIYRQILAQSTPATGFLTEAADVLSESESARSEALQLYEQLVSQYPDDTSLQIKRLIVAKELEQISQTELQQQLLTVLNPLPSSEGEQRSIAQALIRLDPPAPQLLPIYQTFVQSGIDIPFLQFRIAQIELQQGNIAAARQALADYNQARAETTPATDPASTLLLAEIERQENKLDTSAQIYETLISSNPPQPVLTAALRGLAGVRSAQARLPEALAAYDQLVNQNPEDLRLRLGQASLAYQTDRITEAEAEAVLDQWVASSKTEVPPELISLVSVLPANAQRRSIYDQLLAAQPDNLAINRRLIQVLAVQDPAQAQAKVDQLIAQNPNNVNVYFVQGELSQRIGNLEQAGQAYQTILNQQPENTDALSALGGIRFEQKRYADAVSLYQQVVALNPNDLETQRVLAELSAVQDQPLAALAQFEAIQAASSDNHHSNLEQRIQSLRLDLLRRRGFQPYWERY
ncbi:MAG TPA: tetratricopeptide repeat protein [Trichocoleus sp.]|jgi:tetratricopeptide (TPR) repeat protein